MKKYIKPIFEVIELKPHERLAGSGDCRSCQGSSECLPGGNPGGGQ